MIWKFGETRPIAALLKQKIIRNHTIYLTNTKGVWATLNQLILPAILLFLHGKARLQYQCRRQYQNHYPRESKAKAAPADLKVGAIGRKGRAAYNSLHADLFG